MANPQDFRPPRPPAGDWPILNPQTQDVNVTPLIPTNAISSDMVRDLSVLKLQGIGIKVYRSTNQTIATGTPTDITYDTVIFNRGFQDPGATFTTLTVPFDGVWEIAAALEWGSNATGYRDARLTVNGSIVERDSRNATNGIATCVSLTVIKRLTAGDTVKMNVNQNSGADRTISGTEDGNSLSLALLFPI